MKKTLTVNPGTSLETTVYTTADNYVGLPKIEILIKLMETHEFRMYFSTPATISNVNGWVIQLLWNGERNQLMLSNECMLVSLLDYHLAVSNEMLLNSLKGTVYELDIRADDTHVFKEVVYGNVREEVNEFDMFTNGPITEPATEAEVKTCHTEIK